MEEIKAQFSLVLDVVVDAASHREREREDSPEGEDEARAEVLLRYYTPREQKYAENRLASSDLGRKKRLDCHAVDASGGTEEEMRMRDKSVCWF
jgi:hypothetical protein